MANRTIPEEERRKYSRLDTIFPVEFQVVDSKHQPLTAWYQAFSQDVSHGGICLTINQVSEEEIQFLRDERSQLLLQIHSPFSNKSFLAYAHIAWLKKTKDVPLPQYILGLHFVRINASQMRRFLVYIHFRKLLWYVLKILIVALVVVLGVVLINNYRLQSRNIALLERYSLLLEKNLALTDQYRLLLEDRGQLTKLLNDAGLELEILKATLKKEEAEHNRRIGQLEEELAASRENVIASDVDVARIEKLKSELDNLRSQKEEEIARLKRAIDNINENTATLSSNLDEVIARESEITTTFSMNAEAETALTATLKNNLYQWLKNHQNQKTGLVVSFEGDNDLRTVSFLYDHAVAVILYTSFQDYERARLGLDFFLNDAERIEGKGFYNAYYSNKGGVAEYAAHAGPNLWIGIAALQYAHRTNDNRYLVIARQVADWIETLQDGEGGIMGGRDIAWYSTEHNLDGYAFFSMLYELTKEERYKNTAQKILEWLRTYSYSNDAVPVRRGKGDATVATDTYAWSIAALGPRVLESIGMDPHQIALYAIEQCAVTTKFTDRFGKEIAVSGFDFARFSNSARGGIISCEWTAQMVLSFGLLADYYTEKGDIKNASFYRGQRIKYLNELNKMIITSPSAFGQGAWCLPYASRENTDTGHGWRTPKGDRTGSVAATAYAVFALAKENPLAFLKRK